MCEVASILGVLGRDPVAYLAGRRDLKAARIHLDVPRVEELVRQRIVARETKDWPRADAIRDELAALGVVVRDGPDGSVWSL
jgi:cysteinyl-tRNA synthetase